MQITTKRVEELKEAAYNPRKKLTPEDSEYKKIKRSIEKFGYIEPIIYNKRTGNIVGGHQRLNVLKELGYEEVQVTEVDLPPEKEKQLNVTLNKVRGRWDYEKLGELLGEMEDTTLTGFDDWEVRALTADYSHIDDLLGEEFTDLTEKSERESFNMTFTIPLEEKEEVDNFLRTTSEAKIILADIVLQHARGLI